MFNGIVDRGTDLLIGMQREPFRLIELYFNCQVWQESAAGDWERRPVALEDVQRNLHILFEIATIISS
jgi:hypothetical protein